MSETRLPAIEIKGVDFNYSSQAPILSNVDVRVEEGEFASIIGPNGGGKTTLLKLILGVLEPQKGSIKVLGTSPRKALPKIGVMPQHPTSDPLFPIQVHDVVLMGRLEPKRKPGPFAHRDRLAADEVLKRVGISHLARRAYSTLSGGERQRVLLARALVSRPRLLLLDEPEAGLDRKVEQEFFDLLHELNQDTTIVLISHDLGFVASFVQTVICVHHTVDVHPMSSLNGEMIHELYGSDVHLVHHDRHVH